ncbi:MAG: hypothetical protein HQL52_05560 [Magnetococcales bacterium]|nr:hypothetical protein [Magnetococcales bacterium]
MKSSHDVFFAEIFLSSLPGAVVMQESVLAVGSLMSDPISRSALEYSGKKESLSRRQDPMIPLPIVYIFNPDETGPSQTCERCFAEKQYKFHVKEWNMMVKFWFLNIMIVVG